MNLKNLLKIMMVSLIFTISIPNISSASTKSDIDQVILVVGTGGYRADVSLYEKGNNSVWVKKISTNGYVGKNGITDNKKEGDGKTPTGLYDLGTAFGVASNPGTKLSYRKINNNDYWVDDPNSKYYNQWVDIRNVKKDWNSAEHLYSYKTAYKYGVVVNYNMNPIVPGNGSAIFLHNSTNGPTAGCVSIPESSLVSIMKAIKPNAKILIAKDINSIPDDVTGHWAESTIRDFKNKGYVSGYPDNTFRPNNPMTRAEFVKTVNKVFNFTAPGYMKFNDVPINSWYYNDIAIASELGYINGKSDTIFDPEGYITRQEAAKIVATIKGCIDYNYDKINKFIDKNNIADWAKPYVEGVIEGGYMNGIPGDIFAPTNYISRAEVVTVLSRAKMW